LHGKFEIQVESGSLELREYERFLVTNAESIQSFKAKQQAAFDAERQRWVESGQLGYSASIDTAAGPERDPGELPDGVHAIESHVPGSVWKLSVAPGARVRRGDTLIVVESMKMEVSVEASHDGTVLELCVSEGKAVAPGQRVALMRADAS
jgi:urea carboxylase